MSHMNGCNDFALVPRPPGALEKAEPGAKRILSGMVADTLALAKKEPVSKSHPHRIVVVNDEEGARNCLEIMLRGWFPDVTLLLCYSCVEALEELSQSDDLDLLITGTWFPGMRGKELVERVMDRKASYPIIVVSAIDLEETWVREYASRGLNISFLPMPFLLESLRKRLEAAGLKIPRAATSPGEITYQFRKTSPFRIVLVHDEYWFTEMVETAILARFKNVTLQTYRDSNKAWLELSRTTPDLLIVGDVMPELDGEEIVRRLVDRKANYPIIVVLGWPPREQWVRNYADTNSNITFLRKPFPLEQLYGELSKHLGASDNSQPQFRNSET